MTSIHVERRANVPIINFMKKVKQNGEALHSYSIRNSQFVVEKSVVTENLKIAKR